MATVKQGHSGSNGITRLTGFLLSPLFFFVGMPASAQSATLVVCGAETGRVYLRENPRAASMDANRTLSNGTIVQAYQNRNGYALVETNNGSSGWVTQRYLCEQSQMPSFSSYICGAETGRVYLRRRPDSSSQDAARTVVNGTGVEIDDYQDGFTLVTTEEGRSGWITDRYVCY